MLHVYMDLIIQRDIILVRKHTPWKKYYCDTLLCVYFAHRYAIRIMHYQEHFQTIISIGKKFRPIEQNFAPIQFN